MPCSDYPTDNDLKNFVAKQRLDLATKLLCELCYLINDKAQLITLDSVLGLRKWYSSHQRDDEIRRLLEVQQ